jgi:hypothetical protein
MSIRRELIDELLKEYPNPQDVLAEDGLLKQLTKVGQQLWDGLRRGPRATCQGRYPMTDGQIHPLDTSGVQSY